MPKVSVIMSSYNHEKYVKEAIQSVLDQTYRDFEFLIIDDCSTDGTFNVISKFSDPRIKAYYSPVNQGGIAAKRKLFEQAKGEYFALFCSDDVFCPDKLEKQVSFLERNRNIAAVFSNAKIIDDDGKDFKDSTHFYYNVFNQINRARHEWLNRFFYRSNCLCYPSVLLRAKVFRDLGPRNARLYQLGDFDTWLKICLKHEIHVIQEDLVKFRVRANEANMSGNRPEAKMRHVWEEVKVLENYLKIRDPGDLLRIFPEVIELGFVNDTDLIPYFIAQLSLRTKEVQHNIFALDVLYKMLGDRKKANKLKEKCGFDHNGFIKLTGKVDAYNIIRADNLSKEINKLKEQTGGQNAI